MWANEPEVAKANERKQEGSRILNVLRKLFPDAGIPWLAEAIKTNNFSEDATINWIFENPTHAFPASKGPAPVTSNITTDLSRLYWLPSDLLLVIFNQIPFRQILRVALTCTRFLKFTDRDVLWNPEVIKRFPRPADRPIKNANSDTWRSVLVREARSIAGFRDHARTLITEKSGDQKYATITKLWGGNRVDVIFYVEPPPKLEPVSKSKAYFPKIHDGSSKWKDFKALTCTLPSSMKGTKPEIGSVALVERNEILQIYSVKDARVIQVLVWEEKNMLDNSDEDGTPNLASLLK